MELPSWIDKVQLWVRPDPLVQETLPSIVIVELAVRIPAGIFRATELTLVLPVALDAVVEAKVYCWFGKVVLTVATFTPLTLMVEVALSVPTFVTYWVEVAMMALEIFVVEAAKVVEVPRK